MITVYLTFKKKVTERSFDTLTNALIFARSQEIGTSFVIRETKKLLAKGKIEDLKSNRY